MKWASPQPGAGMLIVKRDRGLMGSGCDASVYIDGEKIGELSPGEKLTMYVPAGERMIAAVNGSLCGGAVNEAAVVIAKEQQRTYRIAIGDAGAIFLQPTAF